MHCVKGQDLPDGCIPETRQNVINDVIDWFSRPIEDGGSRMFWLSGVAGCGKSAIARSICDIFAAQSRCVWFFFKESNQAQVGPDRLFATLSRQLSGLDDGWKACLVKILKGSMMIRESRMVPIQFQELFAGPAYQLDGVGPMLIVIDALDESGSREGREKLIETLKRLPNLPPHFRFFITSRPETDIEHAFGSQSWVHRQRLHAVDASSTEKDIKRYVSQRLNEVPGLKLSQVQGWTEEIVSRSGQLFQWAATACKYIKGDGTVGWNPEERMEDISTSIYPGLDGLYLKILTQQCNFENDARAYRRFQSIMGRILLIREPLSMDELGGLWYDEEDRNQVRKILSPLGSLLSGVSSQNDGGPVQPLHISFMDFIRSKERSGNFYIEVEEASERLMSSLFSVMDRSLRFNICGLETSYKRNSEVEDLGSRITKHIPLHLDYACRYWTDHLDDISLNDSWLDRVDGFMRNQLLFWFEVLSLTKKMSGGVRQLFRLREWLLKGEVRPISKQLQEITRKY
jgi:hypothetical protein